MNKLELTSVETCEGTPPAHDCHDDRNADDEGSIITDETHTRQVAGVSALKPKLPNLTLLKFKGEITQFCFCFGITIIVQYIQIVRFQQ